MGTRKRSVARSRLAGAPAIPLDGLLLTAAAKAVNKVRMAAKSVGPSPVRRVHDARVAIKRLRTYWRLARPHVPPISWARERDRLGSLAAALAPFREADVARVAVEAQVGRRGDAVVCALLERWIARKQALAGLPAERERTLRAVARRVAGVVAKLERAGGGSLTFEWLEPGLARSYRRGRRTWRKRQRGGNDLEFHKMRGQVKDLQYQVEFLRSLAPNRLNSLHHRVRAIAEALGEAHDLVGLRETLERGRARASVAAPSADWRALLESIRRTMAAQYRRALAEAEAVYGQPPKAWLKGLRTAWVRRNRRKKRAQKMKPRRRQNLT